MATRLSVLMFLAAAIGSSGVPSNAQAAGNLTTAEWAQVIAMDQKAVQAGAAPPEFVQIDIALSKMIPEGQAIIASHDQAKAREWSRKYNALIARKNELDRKFMAAHPFRSRPLLQDPCISPMGKNICATSQQAQPRRMCSINYGSTVGLIPCD